ncbi:MAG: ribosomal protein S18-alanine N-acetyltransferase [Proteobacteria bacterium]|nr:ribosomal protein S18-alanine N-acetyltransferase [Pseudomonadota bacterium]
MAKPYFDKMRAADIQAVMAIEIASYSVPWSQAVMLDCIKSDYQCISMKYDEVIVGFGILMIALDEAHLLNMCLDKTHQGKGWGKKLLTYLENICIYNQAKTLLLEVRTSSPIAHGLYKSFAFKQIGIRKNYYKCLAGREDAIVMQKKL